MLQVPAYSEINGVTIYQDDTLFYKFYPLAQAPSVRRNAQGDPVFLLVKYALSDEDREQDPKLPDGGGYLNFDVQFEVPQDQLAQIQQQLQDEVDAAWERLRNGTPEERALPGVVGTNSPPTVLFGEPTWTQGTVKLDAPQAVELIEARVAETDAALVAGNSAAFSMDLTEAGATFMERVLVNPDGVGGTNLVPVQVKYDLSFWARLPSVRIHIEADSEKIYNYVRKRMEGSGVDHCTTYDYENTAIDEQTLTMTGAITVQFDDGSGSLPEEVKTELRNYAMELVKQMVASSFFTSTPPAGGGAEPDLSGGDPNNTKKYLKETYDHATMNISLDLEQRSVVEWPIHPQATLETFFAGMNPQQIQRFVRVFKLEDEFFKHLNLTVRAFADYADPDLSSVEVQVHYEGDDLDGVRRKKDNAFTFTAEQPQTWNPSLIGKERSYQYRYRVGYGGQGFGPFSAWEDSTSPDLNVAALDPGRIDLSVAAGDVDFDSLVSQVQVQLAYEDAGAGVPRQEHTILLTPTVQEGRYQRTILQPVNQPLQYRTRYRLQSGEVREDSDWSQFRGDMLVINQDFRNVLKVGLLPAGDGWDDVQQVNVDLKYEDLANAYTVQDTISLKGLTEFKTWRVFLKNPNLKDYQYRYMASYKNGHLEQSGWQPASGSGTLPLVLKRHGVRITILPDVLDFNLIGVTEVTLHYSANGVERQETFTFHDKTPQSWTLEIPEGQPLVYTYQVTHNPIGLDPVVLPEAQETDTVLVLPAYKPPASDTLQVTVLAQLVDYSVTPIVAVDLRYDDDQNNLHLSHSLLFNTDERTGIWNVPLADRNQRSFRYQITYFDAAGAPQTGEMKTSDLARIVVPRLVPA